MVVGGVAGRRIKKERVRRSEGRGRMVLEADLELQEAGVWGDIHDRLAESDRARMEELNLRDRLASERWFSIGERHRCASGTASRTIKVGRRGRGR